MCSYTDVQLHSPRQTVRAHLQSEVGDEHGALRREVHEEWLVEHFQRLPEVAHELEVIVRAWGKPHAPRVFDELRVLQHSLLLLD